jgi:hypothetical protein
MTQHRPLPGVSRVIVERWQVVRRFSALDFADPTLLGDQRACNRVLTFDEGGTVVRQADPPT